MKLTAGLGNARIPLRVDVGFGDAVTPGPVAAEVAAMLEFPGPRLQNWPPETVVVEKLEAMTSLGRANSRMKDFSGLRAISRLGGRRTESLAQAVRATFGRRQTVIQREPVALTGAFWEERQVQGRWQAFSGKGWFLDRPPGRAELVRELRAFLLPVLKPAEGSSEH